MVKIEDGNVLESGADYICHQVNCQGKMNSGVAKQIRNKWPEVYESYLYFCGLFSGKGSPLGMCDMVPVSTGQVVVNMFAQDQYGYDGKQYTDIDALHDCLEALAEEQKENPALRIALPYKIGCVRGGANWDEVLAMIKNVFAGGEVELWRLECD